MSERPVVIVTGASSGIGREIARIAARKEYAVLAIARRKERLDALASEIANDGGACVPVVFDLRRPDAAPRIVAEALARFGRIDALINNAGSGSPGALLEQSDDQIEGQWQLHVAAPLRLCREALPALQQSGGQIVFIGSGVARVPAPYFGAYCAVKAAIRAAATQLRRELRETGVTVTYVDPGSVATEFSEAAGLQRSSPPWFSVKPALVASHIVKALRTRPARLNAVPWQTAAVALGEMFPALADAALSRVVDAPVPKPQPAPPPTEPPRELPMAAGLPDFETALAPVARRLERVKLPPAFLASLLQSGSEVQLSEAAMRWAGMPNKNERAAMAEALDALTQGGFLERTGDETWRVIRTPANA